MGALRARVGEEQVAEEAEWAALEVEGGDEVEEDEGVGEDAAPQ